MFISLFEFFELLEKKNVNIDIAFEVIISYIPDFYTNKNETDIFVENKVWKKYEKNIFKRLKINKINISSEFGIYLNKVKFNKNKIYDMIVGQIKNKNRILFDKLNNSLNFNSYIIVDIEFDKNRITEIAILDGNNLFYRKIDDISEYQTLIDDYFEKSDIIFVHGVSIDKIMFDKENIHIPMDKVIDTSVMLGYYFGYNTPISMERALDKFNMEYFAEKLHSADTDVKMIKKMLDKIGVINDNK